MARSKHHNRIAKKTFFEGVGALAAALRSNIEAHQLGLDASTGAIAERRLRTMQSFEFFGATYFPHYVKHEPATLHTYLFGRFQTVVDNQEGDYDAVAAPRAHAKSTIITQLGTLWCIVTGRKHYPVIIMDALDQALPMLEAIKAELEFNAGLRMDFPEATGQGRVWQSAVIVTANDIKVEVFGSGKKIRGRRHGPHRPDLVIGDDLENDDNVRSPEQRDHLYDWLTKSVLSLGAAGDTMDVFIIGTILHYDSVLARLLNNPLWRTRKFQAIEAWPHRMDLWDTWEEVLLNDSAENAELFYAMHKDAMHEGARICWPGGTTLLKLMVKRARLGRSAFDSEQQNDPISGDDAPFAACINFWVNRLASWLFFGAVDPSLGKKGKGRDPSAILVGGLNRETRVLNVVEAAIAKRKPNKIIMDTIEFQRQYKCLLWAFEAVQFQEFLRQVLVEESRRLGVPVPARPVMPNEDKALRIESLQPHMANESILIHPSHKTLIDQLRHFPKAAHDDGPDALEMLWTIATTGFITMEFQSAGGGRGALHDHGWRNDDPDDDDDDTGSGPGRDGCW